MTERLRHHLQTAASAAAVVVAVLALVAVARAASSSMPLPEGASAALPASQPHPDPAPMGFESGTHEPAAKPNAQRARAKVEEEPVDALAPEGVAPFQVMPRKGVLTDKGFPCSECHDDSLPPDPRERELQDPHDTIVLKHGGGRFWCTQCHADDRDHLRGLKGEAIDFDQSFVLCGECHFMEQRAFFHGAHGKRLGSWRGERVVANCTSCHDPHDPSIKPRLPFVLRSKHER